jgi:hypothetical protein
MNSINFDEENAENIKKQLQKIREFIIEKNLSKHHIFHFSAGNNDIFVSIEPQDLTRNTRYTQSISTDQAGRVPLERLLELLAEIWNEALRIDLFRVNSVWRP